jgi:hypothetical protein
MLPALAKRNQSKKWNFDQDNVEKGKKRVAGTP